MFSSQSEVTFHMHGPVTFNDVTTRTVTPSHSWMALSCVLYGDSIKLFHKITSPVYSKTVGMNLRCATLFPSLQPVFDQCRLQSQRQAQYVLHFTITLSHARTMAFTENTRTRAKVMWGRKWTTLCTKRAPVHTGHCYQQEHFHMLWAPTSFVVLQQALTLSLEQCRDNLNTNAYVRLWSGIIPQTAP
jgi:hypothetical protein